MISEFLRKMERHWIKYPSTIMPWILVICNAMFTFVTVVEARRTDYKADDCAMLLGIVVALILGFVVKIKKTS